jgi:hypothetical protein
MPHPFKASEADRRAQDGGRAGKAWRWFSRPTIEASAHFRDWSWVQIGLQALIAGGLLAVSRIDPTLALSPWILLLGAGWALWTLRAAALKALGSARQS